MDYLFAISILASDLTKQMRTILLLSAFLAIHAEAFSQPLSWDQLGSDPAYCRIFSYQSGNGTVYASPTGGTPPYTYQWTKLSTAMTSTNATWGGLNPGLYKIVVTDATMATLIDTVEVDSINPVANFGEITGNLNPTSFGYTGFIYEEAQFINLSTGFANPNNPSSDTTFFWNLGVTGDWEISHDLNEVKYEGYSAGDYDVCLVALNGNGCADTLCKQVHIFGPVGIESDESDTKFITIYSSPSEKILHLNCNGFSENMVVEVFSVSGNRVAVFETNSKTTSIPFEESQGIYVYTVKGLMSQEILATGKLMH